jgi:hypothetical protein
LYSGVFGAGGRGFRRRGGASRGGAVTLGELPLERGDAIAVGASRDRRPADGVVGLLLALRDWRAVVPAGSRQPAG